MTSTSDATYLMLTARAERKAAGAPAPATVPTVEEIVAEYASGARQMGTFTVTPAMEREMAEQVERSWCPQCGHDFATDGYEYCSDACSVAASGEVA